MEDCPDHLKVKHVLRANANPMGSYCDNRIAPILETISEIGVVLRSFEREKWKQLQEHTFMIFQHDYKVYMDQLKR